MQKLYVVEKLKTPLLGKPAITSLQILTRTNEVTSDSNPDADSYKQRIKSTFPKLFSGLGEMAGEYHIQLCTDAKPFAIHAPRRIAQPLLPKVKECLDKMESDCVIRKLRENEVSPWMSGMVVVSKSGGKVRVCVDLTELNKHVVRPRYQLPTVDEVFSKLGDGAVFSKLDANSGFFQCKLSEESQTLTSFLSPWSSYCYCKVPFGITSGQEYFQQKIDGVIGNSENTAGMVDDICVYSRDTEAYEKFLFPVLQKLQDAGITLNIDKCEFMKRSISFVGHEISAQGIAADERKTRALLEMPTPTCKQEIRRFLGMANQLGKFSSRLSQYTEPLRPLASDKNEWSWGSTQQSTFEKVKEELCSPRVLAKYNPQHETKIRSEHAITVMEQCFCNENEMMFCLTTRPTLVWVILCHTRFLNNHQ